MRCSTDLDLHALGEADALLGQALVTLVRQNASGRASVKMGAWVSQAGACRGGASGGMGQLIAIVT